MPTEILIYLTRYHIDNEGGVDFLLAKMLEKHLGRGAKARIITADDATAAKVDDFLWGYEESSFLPHGRVFATTGTTPSPLTGDVASNNTDITADEKWTLPTAMANQPIIIAPMAWAVKHPISPNQASAEFFMLEQADQCGHWLQDKKNKTMTAGKSVDNVASQWVFLLQEKNKDHEGVLARLLAWHQTLPANSITLTLWQQTSKGGWQKKE